MRKTLLPLLVLGYLSATSFFASADGGYISGQQAQPSTGGTGTSTVFTAGSVVFSGASGVYTQNNSKLFWDNTNNRLGLGTASPATTIHMSSGTLTLDGNTSPSLIANNPVGIGVSVAPSNGTLVIQSTSTTNGNPVINVQNNAGTSVFRVRQDGIVGIAGTPGTDPGYIFAVRAAANQIIGFGASNVADIRAVNDGGAAFQQLDIRGSTIRINPGNEGNMTLGATGGKVVIGGTTPQATLDVIGTASGDGVGVNTMTSAQVAASTPARKGVLVYNTTITALCVSTGTTVMAYSTINGTTLAVCQ